MDMRQTVQAEAGVADPFREELTGRLMSCGHDGSKRLLLSILYHARNEGAFRGSAQLLPGRHAVAPREYRRAIARHPEWLTRCASPSRSCCIAAYHTGEYRDGNVFDRRKIGCTEHIEED